jgi:predicted nuclease of predicted toxin-antitoxin system
VAAVKLDENVPDSVGGILRAAGHDVALVRDQGLAGAQDNHVLAVAASEGRTLVTLDRDFTNILRHSPIATAGIVVIRLHEQTWTCLTLKWHARSLRDPVNGRSRHH